MSCGVRGGGCGWSKGGRGDGGRKREGGREGRRGKKDAGSREVCKEVKNEMDYKCNRPTAGYHF